MSGMPHGQVTVQLLLGRTVTFGLALVNSVILARTLGVERLGTYAYAMGLVALFGMLANMGLGTVVARAIARDPATGSGTVQPALRAQALLAVGVLLVAPTFAALLPGQPVFLGYVALAATQLAIGTLSWPYLAVMSGWARYDRVAVTELGAAAAGTAALLGAAALRGGVAAFLWANVLAASLAVVIARRMARPLLPRDTVPGLPLGALFRQTYALGATATVQGLYTRLDILLLGQLASPATVGLYSAAYKPINLAVYFGGTIAGPLLPVMARAPTGGPMGTFVSAMRGLGAAAPALALTLTGLADPLLRTLYGHEFAPAAPILVILAWSAAANWLYAPLAVALQARGRERWWLASLGAGLLLNAGGNLWAIPRWGAVGAAAATLVSEFLLLGCGVVLMGRMLGIVPAARPVLVVLGATAAAGAVLWGAGPVGAVPAALAALVVYGGLLLLFRLITPGDVTTAVGWVRHAAVGWSRG